MASPPRTTSISVAVILLHFFLLPVRHVLAQDYDYDYDKPAVPSAVESCNGIFLTYTFTSRVKEYPHLKNITAQPYAFKSTATVLNTAKVDFPSWKMFIGFQHDEILVSVSGAVIADGTDLPAFVGNGTVISGYPQMDLKNSIETAGDLNQISAKVEFVGTQFGVNKTGIPMPKTIKLVDDGYKCPAPKTKSTIYTYIYILLILTVDHLIHDYGTFPSMQRPRCTCAAYRTRRRKRRRKWRSSDHCRTVILR